MAIILRHLFSFILPVTVLIVIPYLIERNLAVRWHWATIPGGVFIFLGLGIMILTIRMFARIGKGTLAPWDPTRKLVTGSLYGYVRNPMILGVFTVLLGEVMLFLSSEIAVWAFLFFVINTLYFILSEEPGLEKRFGKEYLEYKQNVPRWIPRMKPWRPALTPRV
jgi:protein-S-isoprenylcysteine O-methyltransferase Ste14